MHVTNVTLLTNAVVKGNLIITGKLPRAFNLVDILVEGNLDLTGLDAKDYNSKNVKVNGEIIF